MGTDVKRPSSEMGVKEKAITVAQVGDRSRPETLFCPSDCKMVSYILWSLLNSPASASPVPPARQNRKVSSTGYSVTLVRG